MLVFLFALAPVALAIDPSSAITPETVVIPSGQLHLKDFLWKPTGPGPFPAILYDQIQTELPVRHRIQRYD